MSTGPELQFKIATEPWEMELVHQLNYRTFVEEIPQHQPSDTPRLVDKFHKENTYLICLCGNRLVGMMAVRGRRPFSLDQKLPDLDSYLPPGRRLCEIRLLAVEKDFRNGQVFRGLASLIWQYFVDNGYDTSVISGTTRQLKLYRHIGFIPFGPLVGKADAMFQPMYLTIESFEKRAEDFFRPPQLPETNFLPGPVAIHPQVRKAFEQPPLSHRSDTFLAEFHSLKNRLCQLTNAKHAEVLLGSGTLANDAVGAQLSLEQKPGLILTNGEFGDRLTDHAQRYGLTFDTLKIPWGQALDIASIEKLLQRSPAIGWLWCVHGETSTGVLNPLAALKHICATANVKLCVDCISTIGVSSVDLNGVYLATGASGKGLAAYPGLALVFYHHTLAPCSKLPRYLDLGWYAKNQGIAFTHSSNLVRALDAAVKRVEWTAKLTEVAETSRWLRSRLRDNGYELSCDEIDSAPGVITIVLPKDLSSTEVGAKLLKSGFLVSYNSDYLRPRNWIQICLMSEFSRDKIENLLMQLDRICSNRSEPVQSSIPVKN